MINREFAEYIIKSDTATVNEKLLAEAYLEQKNTVLQFMQALRFVMDLFKENYGYKFFENRAREYRLSKDILELVLNFHNE